MHVAMSIGLCRCSQDALCKPCMIRNYIKTIKLSLKRLLMVNGYVVLLVHGTVKINYMFSYIVIKCH